MSRNLRICQLIFEDQQVLFAVQRFDNDNILFYRAAELFSNDELLAEFNYTDIRLIAYFAAVEELAADQAFLKSERKITEKV